MAIKIRRKRGSDRLNEAAWSSSEERWRIAVQRDGQRRQFYSTTAGPDGKREAEDKADDWIIEVAKRRASGQELARHANMRFGQLWGTYLEYVRNDPKRKGTTGWRQLDIIGRTWLLPKLAHRKITDIATSQWQAPIDAAYQAGRAHKTLCNIRGAITAFCTWCQGEGYPVRSPARIIIPDDAPRREIKIVQPDGVRTLFTCPTIIKNRRATYCYYIHAWRFELLTGYRPGEIAGLRQEDRDGDAISIDRAINNLGELTTGKNSHARRWTVLPQRALRVLDDQAAMLRQLGIISPWIFPGEDGGPMDPAHCYRLWRVYRAQHGIEASLYGLRHSMVSICQEEIPEAVMQRIMGHSKSMPSYRTYAHEVDGQMARVAKSIDDIFAGILE